MFLALPKSLVPSPRFSHLTALALCYDDAEVPLLRPSVSCFPPPPPLLWLALPCWLAALSCRVNTVLLLPYQALSALRASCQQAVLSGQT
jgi:hypothetical protein